MHLLEIPAAGVKKYFPEDLSQCDKDQYINICNLLFRYKIGRLSMDEFLTHATYYLLDIEKPKKNSLSDDLQGHSNIAQISKQLLSFFEEVTNKETEEVQLQIKQYYIHNPIPSFSGALKKYYGPSDELNNMSFGEYIDALDPYEDFNQTGEVKYLYQLLAIFYRPKKSNYQQLRKMFSFDGDKREQYNPHKVHELAKDFEKQNIGIAYGFYLFFASFQKYITTVKIFIQGREIDFSILFDESLSKKMKESDVPGIGMRSLMYTIAETNIFGNLNELRKESFWEIYVRLYDLRKRDLDSKKMNLKNNNHDNTNRFSSLY